MSHKIHQAPLDKIEAWVNDSKIDFESRLLIKAQCRADLGLLSKEEERSLDVAKQLLSKASEMKMRKFKLNKSSLVETCVMYDRSKTTNKDNKVYGMTKCTVRASVEDVLAYSIDYESQLSKKYDRGANVIQQVVLDRVSSHHLVLYYQASLPQPFQNREFLWTLVWQKMNAKQ